MPRIGSPNNATGENGWSGLASEAPYGEATKQKSLAQGAPLAGGQVAAGAVNAPDRAKRQAVSGAKPTPRGPAPAPAPVPVSAPTESAPMSTAEFWAAVAAERGAEQYPILAELAAASRG